MTATMPLRVKPLEPSMQRSMQHSAASAHCLSDVLRFAALAQDMFVGPVDRGVRWGYAVKSSSF